MTIYIFPHGNLEVIQKFPTYNAYMKRYMYSEASTIIICIAPECFPAYWFVQGKEVTAEDIPEEILAYMTLVNESEK